MGLVLAIAFGLALVPLASLVIYAAGLVFMGGTVAVLKHTTRETPLTPEEIKIRVAQERVARKMRRKEAAR